MRYRVHGTQKFLYEDSDIEGIFTAMDTVTLDVIVTSETHQDAINNALFAVGAYETAMEFVPTLTLAVWEIGEKSESELMTELGPDIAPKLFSQKE